MPLTKTLQVLKLTTLNRKPKNYWFFPGSMNNRKFLPFPPRRDEKDDCSPDDQNTDKSFSKNPFFRNRGFLIDPKFLDLDRNIKDDCPPVSKPSTCDHKNRAFSNPFFRNRGFLIDPKFLDLDRHNKDDCPSASKPSGYICDPFMSRNCDCSVQRCLGQ